MWTFHPKSRFGTFLCVLISKEKHPEGWFPYYFSSSQKRFVFLPVKALLPFLFPWCFLISIPCSCTLTCCKASVPEIPLPQGWIAVTSAAWLGSAAVLHLMPNLKFPCRRKNKAYSRGTVTSHCVGSKTSRAEFLLHEGISCCAQQKDSGQLSNEIICLCFGRELADCAGNLCSRAALTLLMVPAHAGLGEPLVLFIWQGEPGRYLVPRLPSNEAVWPWSALPACAQADPWRGAMTEQWLCLDYTFLKPASQGWLRRASIAIPASSTWRYRADDGTQIRQIEFSTRFVIQS